MGLWMGFGLALLGLLDDTTRRLDLRGLDVAAAGASQLAPLILRLGHDGGRPRQPQGRGVDVHLRYGVGSVDALLKATS